jgi:cell division protease FtsH
LMTTTSACMKYFESASPPKTIAYSQFMQELKQGKIERVGLSADRRKALVHTKDGMKAIIKLPLNDQQLIDVLIANVKGDIYILPN